MKLLLSGEGKTDIGYRTLSGQERKFQPGPMAWIVDKLLEDHLRIGYSLLDTHAAGGDCVRFVDETELKEKGKSGPIRLPGIKYGKGTALFTRNAQVLGLLAKEESGPVIAVLFRDADGTRSASSAEWQEKLESISRGFKLVEFEAGVPMVPRPKSEAWLLCALKGIPDCAELGNAPGNDGSPYSLKTQLMQLIGHEPSAEEQAEWVKSGRIDPKNIRMESFKAFVEALTTAIGNALSKPQG